MQAFGDGLTAALDEVHLQHGDTHVYASPCRRAVIIDALEAQQQDRNVEHMVRR
jgi:glycyl-tRNA synthetase beta subunit